MAFDINYGPISDAMQLAQRAGQGQYNQQNFENSNQFVNTLNAMQRTADEEKATQMQNALGYYQANSQNQLARAQMANLANYRSGMLDYRDQSVGVRQQALADNENKAQAIDNAGGVGGRFAPAAPPITRDPEVQALTATVGALQKQSQDLQAYGKNLSTEEVNPILKVKTGNLIPRPGQESAYRQWMGQYRDTQQKLQAANAALQAKLSGLTAPARPAGNAQVNPQMQQQTAQAAMGGGGGQQPQPGQPGYSPVQLAGQQPPQQPPGQTYVNPQTGQRIVFDQKSQQWVPIQ